VIFCAVGIFVRVTLQFTPHLESRLCWLPTTSRTSTTNFIQHRLLKAQGIHQGLNRYDLPVNVRFLPLRIEVCRHQFLILITLSHSRQLLPKIFCPPPLSTTPPKIQTRSLHHSLNQTHIPRQTTRVPDVSTFLASIGRDTVAHATKFQSWDQFFCATSVQMKSLGIEPARTRRYILRWRETFRMFNGSVRLVEHKRGRKIDGGQRRRKKVRAKRFAEERRKEEGRER
jgi:hypothetical protein